MKTSDAMFDDLLHHYNKELLELQNEALDFANAHPDSADALCIDARKIQDPWSRHLTQSFAFLTAHTQHELAKAKTDLNHLLLKSLAPQLEYPLPSMAIVEFKLRQQAKQSIHLARHTSLVLKNANDLQHSFITSSAIELTASQIKAIHYTQVDHTSKLQVSIQAQDTSTKLLKLHFYIHLPLLAAFKLHHLIFKKLDRVTLHQQALQSILSAPPKQLGFADQEALLPYPEQVLRCHRLTAEICNYPEKFLFFALELELDGDSFGKEFELTFEFNAVESSLVNIIDRNSLLLNCSPIINLFQLESEPIRLKPEQSHYPLLINQNSVSSPAIYKVNEVSGIDLNRKVISYYPRFYTSIQQDSNHGINSWLLQQKYNHDQLSYYLDLTHTPDNQTYMISAQLLCCDQSKLHEMNNSHAKLFLKDKLYPEIENIVLAHNPSAFIPYQPTEDHEQLMMNYLNLGNLFNQNENLTALRNIFKIYHKRNNSSLSKIMHSITAVNERIKWQSTFDGTVEQIKEVQLVMSQDSQAYALLEMLVEFIINDYSPISLRLGRHEH